MSKIIFGVNLFAAVSALKFCEYASETECKSNSNGSCQSLNDCSDSVGVFFEGSKMCLKVASCKPPSSEVLDCINLSDGRVMRREDGIYYLSNSCDTPSTKTVMHNGLGLDPIVDELETDIDSNCIKTKKGNLFKRAAEGTDFYTSVSDCGDEAKYPDFVRVQQNWFAGNANQLSSLQPVGGAEEACKMQVGNIFYDFNDETFKRATSTSPDDSIQCTTMDKAESWMGMESFLRTLEGYDKQGCMDASASLNGRDLTPQDIYPTECEKQETTNIWAALVVEENDLEESHGGGFKEELEQAQEDSSSIAGPAIVGQNNQNHEKSSSSPESEQATFATNSLRSSSMGVVGWLATSIAVTASFARI